MKNSESEKMTITGTMVSKVCSILGIVICVAGFITFMSAFISKYPDYSILIISLVIVFSTSYYIERYFVKKYHKQHLLLLSMIDYQLPIKYLKV